MFAYPAGELLGGPPSSLSSFLLLSLSISPSVQSPDGSSSAGASTGTSNQHAAEGGLRGLRAGIKSRKEAG